jgi:asparagine synthase (glutamine-hydrolysing)
MCGILGAVGFTHNLSESLNSLALRGPDDFGEFFDEKKEVYLGHRRLSILDLSEAGRQPMRLNGANIYVTYNGEVYNFQSIKAQYFSDARFQSHTDTEVILRLYQAFGHQTPKYLRGMFALGLYNQDKGELFLCRDRLGIKPLYYYQKGGKFAFASELSALKSLANVDLEIDPIGLDYYFTYGYIPAPFSAYRHIRKLKPAHTLVYDTSRREIRDIAPYWQLTDSVTPRHYASEREWLEVIDDKIEDAVKSHLISDVPLGVFLSGGLDSSLIVSKMAKLMDRPVKAFTIGFEAQKYDERIYAESMAKYCGAEHHVEVVSPDATAILPQVVNSFGEPFSDASALPTYFVSKISRKYVTVALSGDGGDEIFAGYTRYGRMHQYAYLNGIPLKIRKIVQHLGKYLPEHLPGYGFLQRQGHDYLGLYQEMNSCFPTYEREQLYTEDFKRSLKREEKNLYQNIIESQNGFEHELITQLQLADLYSYLPEDVLTKVDRMSMLHSLETRVPLLDHELVELAFSCPAAIRYKAKNLKYVIKKILAGKVPNEILVHKKQGFGVPFVYWFRNELKTFIASIIEKNNDDPFIDDQYVRHMFNLHQKGGRNFGARLYAILFYKCWRALPE